MTRSEGRRPTSDPRAARGTRTRTLRRGFLLAVPIATALVIWGHPPDPATATDLGAQTTRYIGLHVGLLVMLPLLGIAVWMLLEGLEGAVATAARLILPVALVFYAAFDSLVGIAGGVLSRETMEFSGAERAGAEALAARWPEIPMPIPVISTLGVVSWTLALLAAALAHWRAGSPRLAVLGLALAGPLFGFGHPLVLGVIGMAGLLLAAVALEFRGARREPASAGAGEERSEAA
jgi:hypothetical protein